MFRRLPFLAVALAAAAPAAAQQPHPPMTITVVRLVGEGCAADCPEFIAAQGVVQTDSHRRFKTLLAGLQGRKLPVVINSPGGDVDAAMQMGRSIREAGLDVAVGRTVAVEGRPGRTVVIDGTICSSACTLILAGGLRRYAPPQARLGVHQMARSETERVIERTYRRSAEQGDVVSERVISQRTRPLDAPPEVANKGVPEHLAALGIGRGFTDLTLATPHDKIRVLTPAERLATGIVTQDADPGAILGFDLR